MCAQATIIPVTAPSEAPPEPQTRGYLINLVRNLSPTWLELEIQRVAQAGFNLILFPVYNNGWTLFPSKAARSYRYPAINPLFRKWNPLEHVTRLAQAAGLAVWGFARPYNFHPRHSLAQHKLLIKFPQYQIRSHPQSQNAQSRRLEQWLACPINPDYRRFVGDILTEMVDQYPIDGVVMNFTSLGLKSGALARSPYCFCASCREIYAAQHKNASLVDDASGENIGQVRDWQRNQLHQNLSYIRHRLIQARRTMHL